MTTPIPVTTLSNLRANFVPPSLSDLLYLQQGSEHDRDSAGTLGQILESDVISSFVADKQQWKTFFTEYDEENDCCSVNYGTWEGNVILRSTYTKNIVDPTGVLRNAILILITDFAEDQEYITFSKSPGWSGRIPKGNIGVFFFNDSGFLSRAFPLPCSSSSTNAEFKALTVSDSLITDKLKIKSDLTLQYGSNTAFNVNIEPRVVGPNTYYDLVITKVGDARKIKILGDTFQIVAMGINPDNINFNDELKNFWGEFDGDDFKTLNAEHINSDLVSSKRRVYKDVDISGSGDSLSASQTQYETSLGHSTSFYHLGNATTMFTFDKTTCEIGEEVLLFSPASVYIRYNKDDNNSYFQRQLEGISLIKMVYLGLNQYGNPWWQPLA